MRASSVLTLTLCAPLLVASSALGLKVWLLPPILSGYKQLSTSVMYLLGFMARLNAFSRPRQGRKITLCPAIDQRR